MDLIVKPTDICNFACTFCSSPSLSPSKAAKLGLDPIYRFLKRYPECNTIIINGGDPLMMKPIYYLQLAEYLERVDLKANISMTTNLWAWYKNPEKWDECLRHPRVQVTTSFNYGEGRRISKAQNYTEEIFLKVMKKFKETFDYTPHFIAVIEDDNIDTAINHVRLAKFLDTDCKLNYLNASGRAGKPLPLSFIYEVYLKIWDEGLANWEWNTRQMSQRLISRPTTCPLNRKCDEGIRVLHPDGKYFSCGAMADDGESEIDFEAEMGGKKFTPLQSRKNLQYLKDECLTCPMFQICNGCYKHVKDLKQSNMVEKHCTKMKSIASDILKVNMDTPENERVELYNDTYDKGSGLDLSHSESDL